jgi:hypothetical protein
VAGEDPLGIFDADITRDDLRAAMLAGLPNEEALRPIFHFPRLRTFTTADRGGQPLDWSDAPATDTDDDPGEPRIVTCGEEDDQVVCVWQAGGGRGGTQSNETPFGDFDTERLVLSLFEVDRAKIEGFVSVTIGSQDYLPQFELPAISLYDLTLHQLVIRAVDAHVVKS